MIKMKLRLHLAGYFQDFMLLRMIEGLAESGELKGFVGKSPEGGIELVAEGAENSLSALLVKLRDGPIRKYITNLETSWECSTGEFKSFEIRL